MGAADPDRHERPGAGRHRRLQWGEADGDAALEERIAELEARLTDAGSPDGEADTATETGAGDEDPIGEPAEPRVFEVGEPIQEHGLEIVLDRVVAERYHTEVELRAVNTTAQETVEIVDDSHLLPPRFFDDRDRRFAYQHPAGLRSYEAIEVGPGERLEAVLVFRGAVQPDAELLTFELTPDGHGPGDTPERQPFRWQIPVDSEDEG